jgi:dipeptidyl aminopeptidase/acylaminoacyl peptidase
MLRHSRALATAVLFAAPAFAQSAAPTVAQFLSPSSPLSLVSAKKVDRVAWMAYERGMRNVYTAAAPTFKPVQLTNWMKDDGIDVGDVSVSDDGAIVVFVRGSDPNRQGWIANPAHDPAGADRAIWAVRTSGGAPWRVAPVTSNSVPVLSPDGRRVLYVKDGQIYSARVAQGVVADSMQRSEKPFIQAWGRQASPRWSPDGSRIAFVTDRDNHSFVAIYDVRARTVKYVSPSVDCDGAPTWSPDGKRIAFLRRPGVPFARQAQTGTGSIGNPPGPAVGRGGGAVGSCGVGGFGGGGGGQEQQTDSARGWRSPGFFENAFPGGYRLSIMVADVSTCTHLSDGCEARELWHSAPGDRVFSGINVIVWAADNIIFPVSPATEEFDRYYSLSVANPQTEPVMLTTTDGLIEGAVSAALSRDGKTLFYCTNARDIERRHIWAVPTSGGTPVQISNSAIETNPRPLASGKQVAVLSFDAAQPASVGLVPASGGKTRVIFPTLPKDFPVAAHVRPEIVIVKSPDSLEIHNQLFLPQDVKPGERRPAMIFVHGGPMRQMLPGYHYMQFYHWAYAYNQWLASQGYVVLSVNYRLGIGYGRSFRQAANANRRGNSEYQDVLAAGRYLQSRPDVDPNRVGIWGLSYGGLLTAQALARNSDLFVAGADLAGVHLYGNSLDTAALSFKSSAVGAIDGWKSPVFLVHGDDDRNVDFAQTVGLVSLLRARNVYYELMVVPDDLHESMIHENWVITFNRMGDFFKRFVWNRESATTQAGKAQPK